MQGEKVKRLSISAMLIAVGILLPFITGQIPEFGNMLLPMHIPVFLGGLICGGGYGAAVGFILPLLRSLIFTRPVMYPSAIAMAFELSVYGFVSGLMYMKFKKKSLARLYASIISAMLVGRGVWGVVMAILMGIGNNTFGISLFFAEAFAKAIPGIALQLVLIPAIMLALKKTALKIGSGKAAINGVAKRIDKLLFDKGSVIIAIDGRSGAGKSTFAQALSKKLGAVVLHTDDFFLRPEQRTQKRLSEPGENIDHERFLSEILIPLKSGAPVIYSRFCCENQSLEEPRLLPKSKIIIVEGVYSCHSSLIPYYDLKIFMDVDKDTQIKRISARSGAEKLEKYLTIWIPLEEAYLENFSIEKKADLKLCI